MFWRMVLFSMLFVLCAGCGEESRKSPKRKVWHSIEVTATAYNSVRDQTSSHPHIGAWGDRLEPGMKAIAVSRDLISMGLKHNCPVRIQGLPGVYRVMDKMNRRWKKRIDIYMGEDVEAARKWGKKRLLIHWQSKPRREKSGS